MNPEFFPTHHCFDDAMEFVEVALTSGDPKAPALVIVHAVCRAPFDGEPDDYAHAWVEFGEVVFDAFLLNGERIYVPIRRSTHYALRQVQRAIGYSLAAAHAENVRTNCYGPWEPDLRALCSRSPRCADRQEIDPCQNFS